MEMVSQAGGPVEWEALMRELEVNKLPHHLVDTDIVGKHLGTVGLWQEFYTAYSRWMGFSVRKNNVRKDDDGNEWQRVWVCSREGFRRDKWINLANRKRAHKSHTRTGCKARFSVTKERSDHSWRTTAFDVHHNHELASLSEIQFLRSHRRAPDPASALLLEPARQSQIKTWDILDCVALDSGARARMPFLRKDAFNRLEARRNDIGHETDAEGALGYMTCLAMRDRNLFCKFTVDAENRLDNLFWSDGVSRKDYAAFGDVVAFDTSYELNAYCWPLLVIAGVNHHGKATAFGAALLSDETAETYEWVLEQLLACMDRKPPKAVVTNGSHVLRSAMSAVVPMAVHRLCAWHLEAGAGPHILSKDFNRELSELIYGHHTETEFDEKWGSVVKAYKLEQSEWARSVYDKRRSWAETFLRGNFFGGMRTAKVCGAMEPYMKRFADVEHLLRDFICQIDAGIASVRHVQARDDYESRHGEPSVPHDDALSTYYVQFAKAYTRALYESVAKEIKAHHSYSVTATEYSVQSRVFRLNKFPVGEVRHQVRHSSADNGLACTCLLFETDGIPCRHIFTVMKFLNMADIPACLFTPRWKKTARVHNSSPSENAAVVPQDVVESTRLAALVSEFNALGFYASKHGDTFDEARQELARLTARFREDVNARGAGRADPDFDLDEEVSGSDNAARDGARGKGRDSTAPPAKKKLCPQRRESGSVAAPPRPVTPSVSTTPSSSTQPAATQPESSSRNDSSSNTAAHLHVHSLTDITSD